LDILKYVILGMIQGLAEFLPISSSGHLVLFKYLLDINVGLTLDVFLHFGTLVAVIIVYRRDIIKMITFKEEYRKFNLYIIFGSVPAGLVGILFEDFFENINSSLTIVGFFLIITGIALWLSDKIESGKRGLKDMNYLDSIVIGTAQALAIFPGLSRSGSTIVTGLYKGLNRELAAKYSFILSIPVIGGATLLKAKELLVTGIVGISYSELVIGTISSMITGYFAIRLLLKLIKMQKLQYFAYYCFVLGFILIFIL
jgi:undecaprenyl-diphosphatase